MFGSRARSTSEAFSVRREEGRPDLFCSLQLDTVAGEFCRFGDSRYPFTSDLLFSPN